MILSIENHCKSRATLIQKMANIFTNTFGDKLMKEPFDDMPVKWNDRLTLNQSLTH